MGSNTQRFVSACIVIGRAVTSLLRILMGWPEPLICISVYVWNGSIWAAAAWRFVGFPIAIQPGGGGSWCCSCLVVPCRPRKVAASVNVINFCVMGVLVLALAFRMRVMALASIPCVAARATDTMEQLHLQRNGKGLVGGVLLVWFWVVSCCCSGKRSLCFRRLEGGGPSGYASKLGSGCVRCRVRSGAWAGVCSGGFFLSGVGMCCRGL